MKQPGKEVCSELDSELRSGGSAPYSSFSSKAESESSRFSLGTEFSFIERQITSIWERSILPTRGFVNIQLEDVEEFVEAPEERRLCGERRVLLQLYSVRLTG